MSLDTIVNVTVTRKTQVPSAKGFSTPLLLGYHTRWVQRVKAYSSPDEMITDGFALTDKLYKDAVALCSQTGRPSTFKIGRRQTGTTQVIDITPVDLTQGKTNSIKWNDQTFTYVNAASETAAGVVAGLFAASSGITGATRVNNTTKLTITSSTAGKVNSVEVSTTMELKDVSTDPGIAADLTACYAEDSDWYALTIDSTSEAEVNAASTWANAKTVLFLHSSSDTDVTKSIVTTDIASDLVAASATRSPGIWRRKLGGSTPAAWIGRCITKNPGTVNWAFKDLTGEAVDVLSTTEETTIESKRFSHYQKTGGVNVTYDAKTPKSGEYIDLIVSTDWLKARVQESAFGALAVNDVVPYTDQGIEVIRLAVYNVLLQASSTNFPILDRNSISVTAPTLAETTDADRAARTLPNVKFQGRFQGALNKVVISGDIYV